MQLHLDPQWQKPLREDVPKQSLCCNPHREQTTDVLASYGLHVSAVPPRGSWLQSSRSRCGLTRVSDARRCRAKRAQMPGGP